MTDRERLIEILNIPIYPHESKSPAEVVADYLLDNGVTIPVRCKDCKHCDFFYPRKEIGKEPVPAWYCRPKKSSCKPDDFCSHGERKDND